MTRPAPRRILFALLCAVLLVSLCACAKKAEPAKRTHFALDTVIDISVYDGDREKAATNALN